MLDNEDSGSQHKPISISAAGRISRLRGREVDVLSVDKAFSIVTIYEQRPQSLGLHHLFVTAGCRLVTGDRKHGLDF
jgi:hypothetical protein